MTITFMPNAMHTANDLVFLDTETTGLEGRLIQLAYKRRGDAAITVEYYKPPVPIEFEAMGVHHITEKMVADKPPFNETQTFKDMPGLLERSVLVAHNAAYDIGILKGEGVETKNYICTYKVASCMYDFPNLKLQSLRYRFGIEIDGAMAHDAAGDVAVLEAVFDYIVKEYCATHSIDEPEAIARFVEISKNPLLLKKVGFGKCRDMTFEELVEKDPSYLRWLGTLQDKSEDFIHTVKHYLAKL
jgi:exodeoxyribonuclease X